MSQANDPNIRFSSQHVYVKREDGEARIGMTYFAQDHTSRVSYVEFPPVGQKLVKDQPFATVEAIKATIELSMPVNGEVLAINEALKADPWLINTDPYGQGWMMRIRLEDTSQLDQLMDEDTYKASAAWTLE
jgi:glycine cleavage system H protein